MNYEEEIDLLRNEIFELRKGEDTRIVISELMARIDVQTDKIAELESKIADLEKRNEDLTHRLGKEQVVTMQNREIQLQKYIGELEKNIERLHLVIDSCHEDLNCKSDKIDELDVCHDEAEKLIKKNADQINSLLAQVAALREIAIGERAGFLHYRASCYDPGRRCPYAKGCDDCTGWDTCSALDRFNADAIRQLSEEHPEAFRP